MATGFNIILPNGSVERTTTTTYEQRLSICNALLEKWQKYCLDNWISVNGSNPFSPQNKVKMFLSSLGYFLLTGSSEGILTRYKEVMNGKRQIPVSACPDYIEDEMYGLIHTGGSVQFAKSQSDAFEQYMRTVDEKVERKYKKRPTQPKAKQTSVSDRYQQAKRQCSRTIVRSVVNTDGEFIFDAVRYRIDMDRCVQYAPRKISQEQTLYDMDCVMCAKCADGTILFFDQNYYPIDRSMISLS